MVASFQTTAGRCLSGFSCRWMSLALCLAADQLLPRYLMRLQHEIIKNRQMPHKVRA